MIDLAFEAKGILAANGYTVQTSSKADVWRFEDDSVLGFLWIPEQVSRLLDQWESLQRNLLHTYASNLRRSHLKTWNLYMVMLTSGRATDQEKTSLREIEEDFRATRKIARPEVETLDQLVRGLYPFLKLQNLVSAQQDDGVLRLRARLGELPSKATEIILTTDFSEDAVRRFLEAHASQTNSH